MLWPDGGVPLKVPLSGSKRIQAGRGLPSTRRAVRVGGLPSVLTKVSRGIDRLKPCRIFIETSAISRFSISAVRTGGSGV